MTTKPRQRFDRSGLLAIAPQALFDLFVELPERANTQLGPVAVVDVQGPLEQYKSLCWDSYEAIVERVELACQTDARFVVLRIDSPGGLASGMADCARTIRARVAAAGKTLIAYVDGQGCSAAYAIASAGSSVIASETAVLGSVGVISCRIDVTEQDRLVGTRFAIVASGERKADGNPHVAISEAELVSTQRIVDSLASTFFDLVSELRGIPASKVAALEAGIFHGESAVRAGLADRVQSWASLLASLASAETDKGMSTKYDEVRSALEEIAQSEDENAAKAKRALAALDEEEKPEGESDEDKPEAEDDSPPADEEEKKDDEASASARASHAARAVSASTAGALAGQANDLAARVARLEAQNEALHRSAFLATRPDLSPDLVKLLGSKPFAEVKAIVNAIPAPRSPKLGDKARAQTVSPTQGPTGSPSRLPPDQKAALDAQMGLTSKQSIGVEKSDYKLVLGVPVDVRKGVGHA